MIGCYCSTVMQTQGGDGDEQLRLSGRLQHGPTVGIDLMNPLIFPDSKTPEFEIPRSC